MYGRTDGREWSVLAANDDSIKLNKKKLWAIPAPILRFAISVTLRWMSVRPCDRSFAKGVNVTFTMGKTYAKFQILLNG